MPAPTRFSQHQRAHIAVLVDACGEDNVRIEGYDLAGRPVVYRKDRRDARVYAIRTNGSGVAPPAGEPVPFTIEEAYMMPSFDFDLLIQLAPGVSE